MVGTAGTSSLDHHASDAMEHDQDPPEMHEMLRSDDLAYLVELARRRGIVDDVATTGEEVRLRIGPMESWMHPVEARTFLRRALYVSELGAGS